MVIIKQLGPNVGQCNMPRMTCTASSVTSAGNEWGKGDFPAVCKSSVEKQWLKTADLLSFVPRNCTSMINGN